MPPTVSPNRQRLFEVEVSEIEAERDEIVRHLPHTD